MPRDLDGKSVRRCARVVSTRYSEDDSYDNALAETVNGLYTVELIHRLAPRKVMEFVELATLEWVSWFDHYQQLESIGYIPLPKL